MVKRYTINGPDEEYLSKEQVAAMLKVSVATVDRLVAAGRFPSPIRTGPQTPPFWHGADIAAWLHLAGRMSTLKGADDEAGANKEKPDSQA